MPAPLNARTQVSSPLYQVVEYSLRFLSFRLVLVGAMICPRNLCPFIVRNSGQIKGVGSRIIRAGDWGDSAILTVAEVVGGFGI